MFCIYCGKALPKESRVCGYCGKPTVKSSGDTEWEDFSAPEEAFSAVERTEPDREPFAASPAPAPQKHLAEPEEKPIPELAPDKPFSPDLPVPEVPKEAVSPAPEIPQISSPEVVQPMAPACEEESGFSPWLPVFSEEKEEAAGSLEEVFSEEEGLLPEKEEEALSASAAQSEQEQVLHTARRDRPISTIGFFWTEFLLLIPVLNLILLFVWAFRKKTNQNRRAFARSALIWLLIALLSLLFVLIVMIVTRQSLDLNYWIQQLKDLINGIPTL